MTPSNAIFREVMRVCRGVVSTYDYLPDGNTEYPFIFVGSVSNEDENNSDLIGEANIDVDIYGLRTDRNVLDEIQRLLHNEFRALSDAYGYSLRVVRIITDVRPDNTDRQPLLRVMLRLTINYTKGEIK